MKCPHCLENYHSKMTKSHIDNDISGDWYIFSEICPACKKIILTIMNSNDRINHLIYPKGSNRNPTPTQVPNKFSNDYKEACLVINDSPKASAALSRRCLQNLLRESAGVKHSELSKEIQEVLDSNKLPSDISESIDYIRNIGNFSAHPNKSSSSGEIIDVEPGEAEWCLDVLEMLFDFYFVRPEVIKNKRDELNKKLTEAGKPPMK